MSMVTTLGLNGRQRGAAAVEFAILLALVLVPLTLGVAEMGRAAYYYNTMSKGVRDAARFMILQTPGTRELEAKCLAITGSSANSGGGCTQPVLVPGLVTGEVTVCDRVLCAASHNLVPVTVNGVTLGTANLVTVTISGQVFRSLLGAALDFTFGPISATFSVKA